MRIVCSNPTRSQVLPVLSYGGDVLTSVYRDQHHNLEMSLTSGCHSIFIEALQQNRINRVFKN